MAKTMAAALCFASPVLVLFLIVGCAARPFYPLPSRFPGVIRQPLQATRPYNIAHRGSNGEFPEETLPAYKRAIEEGADFIETDILSSKDGVLICFHDVTLDETTDVGKYKKFAKRKRTYEVQGVNITGFFTVDFTLKELQSLKVKQRYPYRDQQYNGNNVLVRFALDDIPTLLDQIFLQLRSQLKCVAYEKTLSGVERAGDFIAIALDAPRVVGIYPEIKNPVFINQRVKWPDGKRFEDKFVEILKKYGYQGSYLSKNWLNQPAFIQSFAPTSIIHISNLTDLPKILLIDDTTIPTQDTNQSYWEITSDSYFDYIKKYVVGIGPWKDTVVPAVNNYILTPTDLVTRAHAHNLQVHPYTFRNEYNFIHFNFHQDPYEEFDYWINTIGVDGLFTDFTGSLHHFKKWTSNLPPNDSDEQRASDLLHKISLIINSYRSP